MKGFLNNKRFIIAQKRLKGMNVQYGLIGLIVAGVVNIVSFIRSMLVSEIFMGIALFFSFAILVISFLTLQEKINKDGNT